MVKNKGKKQNIKKLARFFLMLVFFILVIISVVIAARLPIPGADEGVWGYIQNAFTDTSHTQNGSHYDMKFYDDFYETKLIGTLNDSGLNLFINITTNRTIHANDWSNITITESQISDLLHTVNGTPINITHIDLTGNLSSNHSIISRRYVFYDNTSVGTCWNGTDTFFGYIDGVC